MIKKIFLSFLPVVVLFIFSNPYMVNAQQNVNEERLEAVVTSIIEEKKIIEENREREYQKLELLVTKGSLKGKKITLENGTVEVVNPILYKTGDKVIVSKTKDASGSEEYFINDFVRRDALYFLAVIFIALTLLVTGIRGISSILGMLFTFLAIFYFILPQILKGTDPVMISIISSIVIIPVIFVLSHGLNRKTISAIIGTVLALIITGVLANTFVDAARLTGFSSEEASFLENIRGGSINIQGILLAGIILGALGILDDITISQAAIVQTLKKSSPDLKLWELYKRAMSVGRDHIASMVNTLFLVYTGASLPLLLLFINSPLPFDTVINFEIIAEEIVRTIVGSIGLIVAVPITTLIASLMIVNKDTASK